MVKHIARHSEPCLESLLNFLVTAGWAHFQCLQQKHPSLTSLLLLEEQSLIVPILLPDTFPLSFQPVKRKSMLILPYGKLPFDKINHLLYYNTFAPEQRHTGWFNSCSNRTASERLTTGSVSAITRAYTRKRSLELQFCQKKNLRARSCLIEPASVS